MEKFTSNFFGNPLSSVFHELNLYDYSKIDEKKPPLFYTPDDPEYEISYAFHKENNPDYISENFDLKEFSVSADFPELAKKQKFTPEQEATIRKLVIELIQPIRTFFNEWVSVLSGLRQDDLNTAVKGSKTSDHRLGAAADITSLKIQYDPESTAWDLWKNLGLKDNMHLKQLIFYKKKRFLHVSINNPNSRTRHELIDWDGNRKVVAT